MLIRLILLLSLSMPVLASDAVTVTIRDDKGMALGTVVVLDGERAIRKHGEQDGLQMIYFAACLIWVRNENEGWLYADRR